MQKLAIPKKQVTVHLPLEQVVLLQYMKKKGWDTMSDFVSYAINASMRGEVEDMEPEDRRQYDALLKFEQDKFENYNK